MLEAVVTRLADRRGAEVSDLLKRARSRSQRGEAAPPTLRTVEELERQAQGRGLHADMAKRAQDARGPVADALPLVRGMRQDGRGEVGAPKH